MKDPRLRFMNTVKMFTVQGLININIYSSIKTSAWSGSFIIIRLFSLT